MELGLCASINATGAIVWMRHPPFTPTAEENNLCFFKKDVQGLTSFIGPDMVNKGQGKHLSYTNQAASLIGLMDRQIDWLINWGRGLQSLGLVILAAFVYF